MKRKWKWLILLCLPLLLFVLLIWTISSHQIPVDVIGEVPEKDVAEIVAAVKRDMRRQILPSFSWRFVKQMPKKIRAYTSIKLISIGGRENHAAILVWLNTNGVPRDPSTVKIWSDVELGNFIGLAKTNAQAYMAINSSNIWVVKSVQVETLFFGL